MRSCSKKCRNKQRIINIYEDVIYKKKGAGAMKETLKLPRGVHGQSVRRPGLDAIFSMCNDRWWLLGYVLSMDFIVCVYVYIEIHAHLKLKREAITLTCDLWAFLFPKV